MSDWTENSHLNPQTYNAVEYGKKLEQERIIKLLENNVQNHNLNDLLTPKLIALIKGEK